MSAGKDHLVDRTIDGLVRFAELIEALAPDQLRRPLSDDWTVSAVLAHLAFWDAWVEARWGLFERDGRFHDLPDDIADLVNAAAISQWRAVPPEDARSLALTAAASVTRRIERLATAAVDAAVSSGRPAMVDRTLHWDPHLEEVRAALH